MPHYLVEHRHDLDHCVPIRRVVVDWAHDSPAGLREILWEPGAHRGWFLVEAEHHLHVHDLIGAIVEMSHNVIHAVLSREEIVAVDRET
jgi:hypothetical protein